MPRSEPLIGLSQTGPRHVSRMYAGHKHSPAVAPEAHQVPLPLTVRPSRVTAFKLSVNGITLLFVAYIVQHLP